MFSSMYVCAYMCTDTHTHIYFNPVSHGFLRRARLFAFVLDDSRLLCCVNFALVSSYSPCFKQPVSNLAVFNVPASGSILYLFIS